jgi:hypothetical protein
MKIYFACIAITLTIGLILQYAHGYIDPKPYTSDTDLYDQIAYVNSLETFVDYCFQHADRPNPLQDLKDKGFSVIYSDCKQVKRIYDEQLDWLNKMFVDWNKKQADYKKNHFCDFVPDPNNYPDCRGKYNEGEIIP